MTDNVSAEQLRLHIEAVERMQPPPKLSLSEWAAKYAVLSAETSAQTGRFRAYAYQVGMMEAVTDPTVNRWLEWAGYSGLR